MKNFLLLLTIIIFSFPFFTNIAEAKNECRSGDCVNGYGVIIYVNGNIYEGEFKNGKRDGQGTLTWTDGEKYEGEWKNGNYHGKGTLTYVDGTIYEGEWHNDRREGEGTLTNADGSKIIGVWFDGKLVSTNDQVKLVCVVDASKLKFYSFAIFNRTKNFGKYSYSWEDGSTSAIYEIQYKFFPKEVVFRDYDVFTINRKTLELFKDVEDEKKLFGQCQITNEDPFELMKTMIKEEIKIQEKGNKF